jgi:tRNA-2-methylthio-N6-dimethylallyladenosine synthase
MDERLQRLQALLNDQQHGFNRATVGHRTSVLIERRGKKPGQMIGKSPWLQSVHLITDASIGDIMEVEIVSAGPNSVAGEPVIPAKGGSQDHRRLSSWAPAFAGLTA